MAGIDETSIIRKLQSDDDSIDLIEFSHTSIERPLRPRLAVDSPPNCLLDATIENAFGDSGIGDEQASRRASELAIRSDTAIGPPSNNMVPERACVEPTTAIDVVGQDTKDAYSKALEEEIAAMRLQLDLRTEEVEATREAAREVIADIAKRDLEVDRLEQELNLAKARVRKFEAENSTLKDHARDLEDRVQHLEKIRGDAELAKVTLENKLVKLQHPEDRLELRNRQLFQRFIRGRMLQRRMSSESESEKRREPGPAPSGAAAGGPFWSKPPLPPTK